MGYPLKHNIWHIGSNTQSQRFSVASQSKDYYRHQFSISAASECINVPQDSQL